MPRAQCIVVRENRLLMVKHCHQDDEWWCLPGGGIEPGEEPAEAAIRELEEECKVRGKILSQTSVFIEDGEQHCTFHVDIGQQEPALG